jgi:regulator of sigma E protease
VLTILSLLVTLSVLILVHEWGHFAAAKWVGIQVPRFSLGLGPKLWGFRRGETEYVISAIPLGGYVKMAGMEDDEAQSALEGGAEGQPIDPDRTFDSKSLWARTLVISAGVIMNLIFAVVVFTVISLVYGESRIATTRVAPIPNAPAGIAAIPAGSQIVSVGERPVGEFADIAEAIMQVPAGPVPFRLGTGATVNVQVPETDEARAELWRALPPMIPTRLGQIERGSPATRW